MKRRFLLGFLFIGFLCSQLVAANGFLQSDSLDSVLRATKNPKDKVDAILKFLEKPENQYIEDTIATELANRAYVVAQQTNYVRGKVNAMIKLGNCYFRSSDYKKAMEYAQQAKEIAEDLNYDKELANSYTLIGIIYSELGASSVFLIPSAFIMLLVDISTKVKANKLISEFFFFMVIFINDF